MQPSQNEEHLGAENPTYPTAHEAQREERAKTGEYLCEACRTQFAFTTGNDLCCPKCKNAVADSLIPIFVPEDPGADEMLSRDDFGPGD